MTYLSGYYRSSTVNLILNGLIFLTGDNKSSQGRAEEGDIQGKSSPYGINGRSGCINHYLLIAQNGRRNEIGNENRKGKCIFLVKGKIVLICFIYLSKFIWLDNNIYCAKIAGNKYVVGFCILLLLCIFFLSLDVGGI